MSLVWPREDPPSHDLTTLEQVKCALGVIGQDDDAALQRMITSASSLIEQYTDRVFAKRLVTEQLGADEEGFSRISPFRITLSEIPVFMVDAMRFDGADYSVESVIIEDAKAGFLFSESGFNQTNIRVQNIETSRTRFLIPDWEVDYSAGYTLPSFPAIKKTFADSVVDASADTFGVVGHGLSSGDTVKFTTDDTLPAPIRASRPYYVREVTDDSFKVADRPGGTAVDLTDGGTGNHTVMRQVTLPESVQGIAIELTKSLYRSKDRDQSIKSERLGDHSVTYSTGADLPAGLPSVIQSQLKGWIKY